MIPWLLIACAGWPRYAHLPGDSGDGRDVDDSASVPFQWQPAADRAEPADNGPDPTRAEDLSNGVGLLSRANLEGTGWALEVPVRATCAEDGAVSAFPPYETGTYAADVDWWVVRLAAGGTLCVDFVAVSESVRVDVVAYPLEGACSLPGAPVRDASGDIAGFATETNENAWSVALDAGLYGVVAAGYAPDGPEKQLYSWGLAFYAEGAACPQVAR